MDNSVNHKPQYTAHRRGVAATDTADLAALLLARGRSSLNAKGYDSLQGFVVATGGTAPTITFQVLELVEYVDDTGAKKSLLVERGSAIGALASGDGFEIPTPGGGRYLLQVTGLTGTPTGFAIHVAGGARASEGSI